MDNHHDPAEIENAEARDILCVAGGAALILLGLGLAMANPGIRKSVKAALTAVAPDLEGPLKAGVRGMMPDFERYLKMKGM